VRGRPEGLAPPDPEVPEKASRRRFTAEYKARIVREADRCTRPGEIGSLLRREGLYSSHLTTWRKQRERGALKELAPKKRGRKPEPQNPLAKQVKRLERENERLRKDLHRAELLLEIQKKASELMGIPLSRPGSDESDY
jgi:transposase-like protein